MRIETATAMLVTAMIIAQAVTAAPSVSDYDRAIGLRNAWSQLTENIAEPDNRMDKLDWNEEWMGWPLDESYAKSSGVDNAKNLKGHILMVVGELDMNVDPSSTMQVVNAMIKARKEFDLLVVPNEGHGVFRSSGDLGYGLRRQYDFFVRHLRQEPTPNWNLLQ